MIKTQTTLQKVFFWNMMGSLSSALISVFLLMVVSRVLSTLDSDIYAFSYSLGTFNHLFYHGRNNSDLLSLNFL